MNGAKPAILMGAALIALILSGCTGTPRTNSPAEITRGENGFTIEESARAGLGARADFEKANAAIEAGDLEAGIELLQVITKTAPQFTAAQINLSIAYQRNEDFEAAESALQQALEFNPKHPVALNELGIVQRRTGRFSDARASFEKALSLHPEFHFARKNLAVLCDLFLNEPLCALQNYRLYSVLNPEDEAAEIWIADLENRTSEQGR